MQAGGGALEIGSLYAAHAEWLRGWLQRYTRCPHKAADLAQDTFCRLVERVQPDPLQSPKSYLATVARRLVIDDARRARVEGAFLDAYAALVGGGFDVGPDRIAEAVDDLVMVARALETLAERPRRAYLLARLDGMSHADIAAELRVSKSMVKQYVAQAYARCYAATYGTAADRA